MFGAYWNYCQISDGVLYYTDLRPTENEVHSMNKTFKIVFNKARGTLMVANELTSSVQKKGVSLVAATAAVLTFLTVPAVNAANIALDFPTTLHSSLRICIYFLDFSKNLLHFRVFSFIIECNGCTQ